MLLFLSVFIFCFQFPIFTLDFQYQLRRGGGAYSFRNFVLENSNSPYNDDDNEPNEDLLLEEEDELTNGQEVEDRDGLEAVFQTYGLESETSAYYIKADPKSNMAGLKF